MPRSVRPVLRTVMLIVAAIFMVLTAAPDARAATCDSATSPGTAPPSWQTYCWLDLVDYNDTTARSASGQNFSFTLSDGSTLSLNLQTTSTAATGATARPAPSWSGAAVGNTPFPHVTYTKQLGAGGRIFDTDQFRLRIRDRTDGFNVIQTDTEGTGSTFTVDSTGPNQVTAGNTIRVIEFARGTTVLADYNMETACTNANSGSTTTLPTGARRVDFVPQMGDVITCIVTNTRNTATAIIDVTKTSAVISDPTGSANPKAIPGAIIEYTITVSNRGDAPVDADSLEMLDLLPADMGLQTAFPVTFAEGTTPSGLDAFNTATMVAYSDQAGGTAPYSYAPAGPFDTAATGMFIAPSGIMAASDGTNHPTFVITYRMRVE